MEARYIVVILFFLFFIIGVIFMQTFGHMKFGPSMNAQANYQSFGGSIYILFRISTNEWVAMANSMEVRAF